MPKNEFFSWDTFQAKSGNFTSDKI